MHKSILYWIIGTYRSNPPATLAQDLSPAAALRRAFRKLAKRWQDNFDRGAEELADYFATAAQDRTEATLKRLLKRAGFTVKFEFTAATRDALQAVVGEQVGLIKSIASEHLTAVEGEVMRAAALGRDAKVLADALHDKFGSTKRRAALIARDQNNKATATITKVRQEALGMTQAVWMHSRGGNKPRPEHVAFSGKRYDISKGAFLEGKWVWPGTEINCRCVSGSIIPGFDD